MKCFSILSIKEFNNDAPFFILAWFALFVGAFLCQLVILPYVFPSMHVGHGLLVGGDTLAFHNAAEQLADKMRQEGWSHWQLQPSGWGHVGISAIFYYYFTSSPWILIPLSSFLMALNILMIRNIVSFTGFPRSVATISSFSLIFLPSTIMINMQWHKDSISVVSSVAVIFGYVYFCAHKKSFAGIFGGGLICILGLFGLYLVRNHLIMLSTVAIVLSIIFVFLLQKAYSRRDSFVSFGAILFAVFLTFIAVSVPSWTSVHQSRADQRVDDANRGGDQQAVSVPSWTSVHQSGADQRVDDANRGGDQQYDIAGDSGYGMAGDNVWRSSSWLPSFIDRRFALIAEVRRSSVAGAEHGCSNFGTQVSINGSIDFLEFLPRALMYSIFSPFPNQWLGNACSGGGRALRILSGIEMTVAYALFVGVLFIFLNSRLAPRVCFVILSCLAVLVIHGFIFVNAGTLFRTRYAWFSILISFGVAGWLMLIQRKNKISALEVGKDGN